MDDLSLIQRLANVFGELETFLSVAMPDSVDARRWGAELTSLRGQLPAVAGRLAEQLSRLVDLESDFQTALETAKLDAVKEFAYGASHEINNPLANISARAQTLLQDERDPERRRRLAAINSQAFRAHEMIADMMLFARPPRMNRVPVDLVGLIRAITSNFKQDATAQNTQLIFRSSDAELTIKADAVHLRVAITVLVTNAIESLGEGGTIEVDVRPAKAGAVRLAGHAVGETVQIVVTDSGPGIAPEARPHIFDPFYSGREAGRGLGLGLSKCWRIVTEHGGRIDVLPAQQGVSFQITLPA